MVWLWRRRRRRAPPPLLPPARASQPAPDTPVQVSDPARPWVGRARARGCRAGTKGGGLGPICSALPVRLGSRHTGVHTAARTHADESGTAARAGAGIDSGGGGILVNLDLGKAVYGLWGGWGDGPVRGQGGGRRCLRRRRGTRGSRRSIQDETKKRREDNRDKRQSTTIPANSTDVTGKILSLSLSTLSILHVHLNVSTRSQSTLFSSTRSNVSPKSHQRNTIMYYLHLKRSRTWILTYFILKLLYTSHLCDSQ
ncbi:hypothetical protein B0H13DRAFT_2488205 [Mycena leptocephala]|nr:hypothetical protein B0H13DRAFT_2488205 [Mycena leptocephala]